MSGDAHARALASGGDEPADGAAPIRVHVRATRLGDDSASETVVISDDSGVLPRLDGNAGWIEA